MAQKIDFKGIVEVVRWDMLPRMSRMTPADFSKLSDKEKDEVYRIMFDIKHDMSDYLTSALHVDDLGEQYGGSDETTTQFNPEDY